MLTLGLLPLALYMSGVRFAVRSRPLGSPPSIFSLRSLFILRLLVLTALLLSSLLAAYVSITLISLLVYIRLFRGIFRIPNILFVTILYGLSYS